MSADAFFQQVWYRKNPSWISNLLLPLSAVFRLATAVRRFSYSLGLVRQYKVGKPVVVIGNITVGGTGKTPFTIWLANQLQARGLRVGVVLRGYGARPPALPYVVDEGSSWRDVGDEALVIASATGAIVVVDPRRVRAAQKAIELGAQVILSDDGLQHLPLGRDYEIAVLDGARELGNQRLLPAGPLREPASRLRRVNRCVIMQRGTPLSRNVDMGGAALYAHAVLGVVQSLTSSASLPLSEFSGQRVHGVAGIGNPSAFFAMLREAGLEVVEHAFPDHAALSIAQLDFGDDAPVLMTQKDAVRCRAFADERMWAVHMEVLVDSQSADALLADILRVVSVCPQSQPKLK